MHRILVPIFLACLLAVPFASAVLVETPLTLDADKDAAEVGQSVVVTIEPKNDSVARDYASRTLRVQYTYDAAQEGGESRTGEAGSVTLDADARGSFTWVVPQEVDDTNVFLVLMHGEETAGSVHIAVGDAPPIMFATGGEQTSAEDETTSAEDDTRGVPFVGGALVAVVAAGAALLLARRR
jgi:hypothetical protein